MSQVAVVGTSASAVQWATRFLAAGHDVAVSDLAVKEQVIGRWPDAERLGVFPGADLARLRVAVADDLTRADFVHVINDDSEPDAIMPVLRALLASGIGAAAAIAEHEAQRLSAGPHRPWVPGDTVGAPLSLYSTNVKPDWVDYNGHMTEAAYLTAAGWASDAMFRYIGDDESYRATGHSFYTVETHIHFIREVAVHEPIAITTQVLGADTKRLHLVHSILHGTNDHLVSTVEQMLLHVDMNAGRACAMLPDLAAAVRAIVHAHQILETPPQVGTVMRIPPSVPAPSLAP